MKALALILTTFLPLASTLAQAPAETPKTDATAPAPAKRSLLKYTPPKNLATGARIDGDGGSRAGGVDLPKLYVLAPNHAALTTREQPSLFWYQSGPADARFELTLIEPKKPKPLVKVGMEKAAKPGIHRLSLARQKVTLTPGIAYKWTIALVPDPANRSQDNIASGTIQRIEPDAKLAAELAGASAADKAPIYAANGIWYDAIEALSDQIEAAPNNKELRLSRATLLDQAGLKDAAAADRK